MVRSFLIFCLGLTLLLATPVYAFSKTSVISKPTATPSSTPVPVVNSFELFWPLVAGKTMQSKLYFLKTLKEDIRGLFIFGSAQKSSYDLFLGTKRMLEAETLIKVNASDLANKTLDSAISDLDKANSSLESAKNSGDVDQGTKDEINMRVSNLRKFVDSLLVQYSDYKERLQNVSEKLNSLKI